MTLDRVTAVLEPPSRISSTDLRERLLHRLKQGFVGARPELPEDVLYLRERLLYGVEVRRVGRQIQELSAPLASMSSLILLGLWAPRLSITTICPSESEGAKKCST